MGHIRGHHSLCRHFYAFLLYTFVCIFQTFWWLLWFDPFSRRSTNKFCKGMSQKISACLKSAKIRESLFTIQLCSDQLDSIWCFLWTEKIFKFCGFEIFYSKLSGIPSIFKMRLRTLERSFLVQVFYEINEWSNHQTNSWGMQWSKMTTFLFIPISEIQWF